MARNDGEIENPFSALASYFFAGDKNDPRVNQALRQRLALELMGSKRKYPTNIGEGIASIGDSFADVMNARRTEAADIAAQGIRPPPPEASVAPARSVVSDEGERPIVTASLPPPGASVAPPGPPPPPPQTLPSPAEMTRSLVPERPPMDRPQPGQVTTQVDMPTKAPIRMDPAAAGGQELGNIAPINPTKYNVAQSYMDPGGSQSGGVGSLHQAMGGGAIDPLEAGRQSLARALLARQGVQTPPATAPGVPQPNPTQPGAALPPPPPLASFTTPSPDGSRPPDQRLAQDTSVVSDIGAAPQVQPIRKAPQPGEQPAAIPGYVPPEPGQVPGAPVVGMSRRELQLQQWLAANQGNPYAAMKVAPELQSLQAERTQRQHEVNKRFEEGLKQQIEQAKMRQQALMDQSKRIADVEHVKAQTLKEGIVEEPEGKFERGPDGVLRPLRIAGQDANTMPNPKLTEDQRKQLVFHGWATIGNAAVSGNDQLLAHGLGQEAAGKIPIFGNAAQNEAYRRAKSGADNFILAFMRSTSGAQYGPAERLDHVKGMLPKLGDDAKTLADKAAQRQNFIDTEYAGLGPGRKIADFLAKTRDPASEERQQRLIDIEMQGVKPAHVGDVKVNKKTGAKRIWNGSSWKEEPQ